MNNYSRLISYVFAGLVLSAGIYFLAVRPTMLNVSTQIEEASAVRSQVVVLDQQILAYRTAQSDLSKAENRELLETFVVNDKNLHITIEEVERAAQATSTSYQFDIHRDEIGQSEAAGTQSQGAVEEVAKVTTQNLLEEVPYTLTVSNPNYAQLVRFFQYIENLPHFTEISNFVLSVQNDPDSNLSGVTAVADGIFLVERGTDED
jgi:type II secretory pathway pseudopilin PulG